MRILYLYWESSDDFTAAKNIPPPQSTTQPHVDHSNNPLSKYSTQLTTSNTHYQLYPTKFQNKKQETRKFAALKTLSNHLESLANQNSTPSMQYQCESETFESICDALAEVYYAAVVAFGGDDATPGKRSSSSSADLIAAYEEKLAIYNQMLEDAKSAGTIPANTTLAVSRVSSSS